MISHEDFKYAIAVFPVEKGVRIIVLKRIIFSEINIVFVKSLIKINVILKRIILSYFQNLVFLKIFSKIYKGLEMASRINIHFTLRIKGLFKEIMCC